MVAPGAFPPLSSPGLAGQRDVWVAQPGQGAAPIPKAQATPVSHRTAGGPCAVPAQRPTPRRGRGAHSGVPGPTGGNSKPGIAEASAPSCPRERIGQHQRPGPGASGSPPHAPGAMGAHPGTTKDGARQYRQAHVRVPETAHRAYALHAARTVTRRPTAGKDTRSRDRPHKKPRNHAVPQFFRALAGRNVAEGEGFEPPVGLHPQRFSRPPHSTALPSFPGSRPRRNAHTRAGAGRGKARRCQANIS